MTNLDSILKSRDIALPTKVHLVKAMVFPEVMYGYEGLTVKNLPANARDGQHVGLTPGSGRAPEEETPPRSSILAWTQGTLKSLLQHHSSKASILWCSAFFIVQLSHPYITTGKMIALTRWTFVNKVILCTILDA